MDILRLKLVWAGCKASAIKLQLDNNTNSRPVLLLTNLAVRRSYGGLF